MPSSRYLSTFAPFAFMLVAVLCAPVLPLQMHAQATQRTTMAVAGGPLNVDGKGIALKGFDPVAYFSAGTPTKGLPTYSATWQGATYHFSSAANREAFVAKPDAYAPQYGGYCAMGVAGGAKFDIDPTAWRVENGRLYLNKDPRTQTVWLRDVPGNIVKADSKWPTVAGKPKR